MKLFEILECLDLCESKTKARKLIEQGACRINGEKQSDPLKEIDAFLLNATIEVGPKHKNNSGSIIFVKSGSQKNKEESVDAGKLKVFIEEFSKLKEFYILMLPLYHLMTEKYAESKDKEWYLQYLLDCKLDTLFVENKERNKQELLDFYKNKTEETESIIRNLETANRELAVLEHKSHHDLRRNIEESAREIRKVIRELSVQVAGHRWCIRNIDDVFNNHVTLRSSFPNTHTHTDSSPEKTDKRTPGTKAED